MNSLDWYNNAWPVTYKAPLWLNCAFRKLPSPMPPPATIQLPFTQAATAQPHLEMRPNTVHFEIDEAGVSKRKGGICRRCRMTSHRTPEAPSTTYGTRPAHPAEPPWLRPLEAGPAGQAANDWRRSPSRRRGPRNDTSRLMMRVTDGIYKRAAEGVMG